MLNGFKLTSLIFFLALISLMDANAQAFWETKITASDATEDGGFGKDVALYGNRALIGADGAAYIYEQNDGEWIEKARLATTTGISIGQAVSLYEDLALVAGSDGTAIIFELQGDRWVEVANLATDDGVSIASVSIYGQWVLMGAPTDDAIDLDSGSAYLFKKQGGQWNQVDKILGSNIDFFDYFGRSVSIYGNQAVIGADWDDSKETLAGAAYIYEFQKDGWKEVAIVYGNDTEQFDFFGNAVSLNENRALIGAYADDEWGDGFYDFWVGSAYVFDFIDGVWTEVAKLTASDGQESDSFGRSVSLSGNRALIGSKASAYIFELDNEGWKEAAKITASDLDNGGGGGFGNQVALSGDHAFLGAMLDDNKGDDAGAVYAYNLDPSVENRFALLMHKIDDFYANGWLSGRQHNEMISLLDQALATYEKGRLNDAFTFLDQFILIAEKLLSLNRVPDEAVKMLIVDSYALIEKIESENTLLATRAQLLSRDELSLDLPDAFSLQQNYPNPFNPSTVISFGLPESNYVRLGVYDVLGREVQILIDGVLQAGNHSVGFDATGLSGGTYLYRIETEGFTHSKVMHLSK